MGDEKKNCGFKYVYLNVDCKKKNFLNAAGAADIRRLLSMELLQVLWISHRHCTGYT